MHYKIRESEKRNEGLILIIHDKKFNWGKSITIIIISFMGFILFMAFKTSNTKSDLNAKDSYKQEVNYQSKIDAEHCVGNLKGKITLT